MTDEFGMQCRLLPRHQENEDVPRCQTGRRHVDDMVAEGSMPGGLEPHWKWRSPTAPPGRTRPRPRTEGPPMGAYVLIHSNSIIATCINGHTFWLGAYGSVRLIARGLSKSFKGIPRATARTLTNPTEHERNQFCPTLTIFCPVTRTCHFFCPP